MPIKGITDRNRVRIPTIGHLRKGDPKTTKTSKQGKEYQGYGEDLMDHFRFDSDDPALVERFYELYGDKPNYIRVAFPFPEVSQNFDPYLEEWRSTPQGGLLIRRCDGEQITKHLLEKSSPPEHSFERKPCIRAQGGECGCKHTLRMGVFVTDLEVYGLVVVHSTSLYDILRLDEQLPALYMARNNLAYLPLELYRTVEDVTTTDAQGKKRKQPKGILNLCVQSGVTTRWLFQQHQAESNAHTAQPVSEDIEPGARYTAIEGYDSPNDEDDGFDSEREGLITVLSERKRVKRDAFDSVPTERLREMWGGQGVDFQKLRERKQQERAKNEPVAVGTGDDDLNPPF